MTVSDITQYLKKKAAKGSDLNAVLKFDMGPDGVVCVDATVQPHIVHNRNLGADCTIILSQDHMRDIICHDLDPMSAFMMGHMKIEGRLSVALKLHTLISKN